MKNWKTLERNNIEIDPVPYFGQNINLDFHRRLLQCSVRTRAFQRAISRTVKPGDIVADIGSGTGILSLFACEAGADHIYALELGRDITNFAKKVARKNGFHRKITFISGNSRVNRLPELCDVVVSECIGWMMYGGIMISAVTDARDQFLKANGVVIPRELRLYAAPVESMTHFKKINSFNCDLPYGFDFNVPGYDQNNTVYRTLLPSNGLLAEPLCLEKADLLRGHPNEMLDRQVEFRVLRNGMLHGFALWFEADLCPEVGFSTSPFDTPTYWKQTFIGCGQFPLKKDMVVVLRVRLTRSYHGLELFSALSWKIKIKENKRILVNKEFSTKKLKHQKNFGHEFDPKMDGRSWNRFLRGQIGGKSITR